MILPMGAAREIQQRANVEALVVEVLDGIASPAAREAVLDRALALSGRRSLPGGARETLAFVTGPLRQAAAEELGDDAAVEIAEQLQLRMAPAVSHSMAPPDAGGRTLPPPSSGVTERAKPSPSAVARRMSPPHGNQDVKRRRRETRTYDAGVLTRRSDAPRVILVDDDPSYRRALTRVLTEAGYEVATAHDAETALWLCQRLTPDVVVTDLELGDESGLRLAQELGQRFGSQSPPVVLITASTVLPKASPAVAYMMLKGDDDSTLLAKLAELVAGNGSSGR